MPSQDPEAPAAATEGVQPDEAEPDEAELLRRCGHRDQAAFELLYDRHADGVLRYCRRRLPSAEAAEEITQDAFFLLWQKAKTVTLVQGSTFPWLYTTAKFLLANHQRKKGNQPMLDIDELDVTRVLAQVTGPEDTVIDQDTVHQVLRAVAAMPLVDQQVFYSHFVGGGSYREIAGQLGLSTPAVKNRVLRMRQKLKSDFAQASLLGGGE